MKKGDLAVIVQINDEVFTIECDLCGEKTAYFYREIDPETAIEEDSWHVNNNETLCSICFIPPAPELNLDKWTIQDLLRIAPKRDYHTRKGIIEHIIKKNDLIPDDLKEKYEVTDNA